MSRRYTTIGAVRGSCGHMHRSIRTALDCIDRDSRHCRQLGGYSDRHVAYADGSDLDGAEYTAMSAEVDCRAVAS